MNNSNETVSTSNPQLEVQFKKEFNPEKSKIFPQCSQVALQAVSNTLHDDMFHYLKKVEQRAHNEHYITEDISVDEYKLFLI